MEKIVLKPKEAQVFFSGCRCVSRKGRLLSVAQKEIESILAEV